MAQDRATELLRQGITAARAGQQAQARQILQQAVRLDPQNENIWLWLSSVATDNRERIFCLKQILQINPKHEMALKGLRALGVEPAQAPASPAPPAPSAPPPPPPPSVPLVSQDKLRALQAEIEEFATSYNPVPRSVHQVQWVRKTKRRYMENAARRLRRTYYAAVSSVLALLIVGSIASIFVLDINIPIVNPAPTEVVIRPSLTPSITPTPTITPTIGVANTATPSPVATRTEVPLVASLAAGDIFPTATEVYPPFNPNVRESMGTAVAAYNLGDYETVNNISTTRRELQGDQCFPELYYYDALGLATQGNYAAATDLLNNALSRSSCTNVASREAFLNTGLCIVNYQAATVGRTPENYGVQALTNAIRLCGAAIETDGDLSEALNTLALANIALAENDFDQRAIYLGRAAQALDIFGLNPSLANNFVDNVAILLTRAEIELLLDRPAEALIYVDSALRISPADQLGLQKRVEVFERTADLAEDEREKILRYGEMAINAETFLNFYPGEPLGYVLLAKARLREGNPDRALTTINRVLAIADSFPPRNRQDIIQAYAIRAEIYLAIQNSLAALDDLAELQRLDPNNPAWALQRASLAYDVGDFELAFNVIRNAPQTVFAEDPRFALLQARLLSVVCQFNADVECEPQQVLELVPDALIATLRGQERSDALVYRAEASFALTVNNLTITQTARQEQLNALLVRVNEALEVGQSPDAYYLLGRLYESLSRPREALQAYEWVMYWSQFYDYDFAATVQERIPELQAALGEGTGT